MPPFQTTNIDRSVVEEENEKIPIGTFLIMRYGQSIRFAAY